MSEDRKERTRPPASPAREEIDRSGMLERPGLLGWLLFRLCYSLKGFRREDADCLRERAERARLVYVASHKHIYNVLYFNRAFSRYGLPLAGMVTGVFTLIFRPFRVMLRYLFGRRAEAQRGRRARQLLDDNRALMICLRRGPRPGAAGELAEADEALRACVAAQRAGGKPILLQPLHLFWGSYPLRPGTGGLTKLRRLIGGPEDPGAFRSFAHLFRYFRNQWARLGEPLELATFLAAHPDADDDELIGLLRDELQGRTEQIRRVVQGPRRKGVARIRRELLKSESIQLAIGAEAERTGEPVARFEKAARRYLKEIAADPNPHVLNVFRWLLRKLVWFRIYDGLEVDEQGMERLRAAAAKGPLVFMPSHRSHVDYLLLSWIVAHYGIAPPCIAAGANLSFFPIGGFFRRSGAFFLRRSFWQNRLYTACLSEYLGKILGEGYNLEFFIEGTRSRTGKMLIPRMGLMKWVVDATLTGRAGRPQAVSLAIGYEKVIEVKAYTKETAGGKKRKEDVGELLKTRRVLSSRFGRLNLHVGEPYDLIDALDGLGVDGDSGDPERAAAVNQLAFRTVREISELSAVTPTALVAAGLLIGGRRFVSRVQLDEVVGWLLERLRDNGARVSRALVPREALVGEAPLKRNQPLAAAVEAIAGGHWAPAPEAVEKSLLRLAGDRTIALGGSRDEPAYQLPDEGRYALAYYRNGLINFLTAESIVARALLTAEAKLKARQGDPEQKADSAARGRAVSREEVRQRAQTLSRWFKHEFVYQVGESFDANFDATVTRMLGWGLAADGDGIRVAPGGRRRLELLTLLLQDYIEAYLTAARSLRELLKGPMGRKNLIRRMTDGALRAFYRGELQRREACGQHFYYSAVSAFEDLGVLQEAAGRSRQGPPVMLTEAYQDDHSLGTLEAEWEAYLWQNHPHPDSDRLALTPAKSPDAEQGAA